MFHILELHCPSCKSQTALSLLRDGVVCIECGWTVEALPRGIHTHQQLANDIGERRQLAERGRGAVLALVDMAFLSENQARAWIGRFEATVPEGRLVRTTR